MKPAIFNTEMVRAILDGRKTQTRRVCKVQPNHNDVYADQHNHNPMQYAYWALDNRLHDYLEKTPYKVGDIIYVREQMYVNGCLDLYYSADDELVEFESCDWDYKGEYVGKIPSIHMPKEYARLFLRVKDVRIERLNEISEEDAKAEGIETIKISDAEVAHYMGYTCDAYVGYYDHEYTISKFAKLWESIYGKDSFDSRYVWVIEFEQIRKEEAHNG